MKYSFFEKKTKEFLNKRLRGLGGIPNNNCRNERDVDARNKSNGCASLESMLVSNKDERPA